MNDITNEIKSYSDDDSLYEETKCHGECDSESVSEKFDSENESDEEPNDIDSTSTSNTEENDNRVYAKDRTKWEEIELGIRNRKPRSFFKPYEVGPTSYTKRFIIKDSLMSSFNLIITPTMLKKNLKYTKAGAKRQNDSIRFTIKDIYAFIGLLFLRGASGAAKISVTDLWSHKWGFAFYRNVMPREKFIKIMKYIRFDQRSTRHKRLESDKFALISEIWNSFVSNS